VDKQPQKVGLISYSYVYIVFLHFVFWISFLFPQRLVIRTAIHAVKNTEIEMVKRVSLLKVINNIAINTAQMASY